jgi:hypothetical protein
MTVYAETQGRNLARRRPRGVIGFRQLAAVIVAAVPGPDVTVGTE